jgi:hypothetical protein
MNFMNLTIIVLLSGVFGLFTCSDSNVRSLPASETPSQVVREYVSLARQGEFQKLEALTGIRSANREKKGKGTAAENTNRRSNTKSGNGITIVPDDKVFAGATGEWVNDFARSIHDGGLFIESIRNESVKGTEGRVEIVLRNDKTINVLGWVFLLEKVDDKWKIYNITTPGDASAGSE